MSKASRTFFGTLVLAALAWWVASLGAFRGDSWHALLRRDMVLPCGTFLALSITAYVTRGIRWSLFLNETRPGKWAQYITAYGVSFALGAVTPARSGDLLRIGLTQKLGHSYTRVTGAYIIERITDLLLLFLVLSLGIWLVPLPLPAGFGASAFVCALVLLFVYLLLGTIALGLERTKLWRWINSFEKVSVYAAELHAGFKSLAGHRNHLRVIILGMLIWALHVAATASFLSLAFPDLPVVAGLLFLTLTNLSGLLQITPGNVGPYEVVGMLVLEQFGIATPDALAVAAGLHVFSLLSLSGYGGLCYLFRDFGSHGSINERPGQYD